MRALHTPGHRPEHTSFALIDTARRPEPWAVLTGDTLFVGDIARPDLAVDKVQGAHGMFTSLRGKLLTLPGECEVWPGHLGGSLCGGPGMNMKISSTIAYERAHNDLLAEGDEERFVARAIGSLAPQPPNFQAIVARGRGPLHTGHLDIEATTARQVELMQADGGGPVLAVPVLVYVLGQSVHQATTASLVVVTAGALTGGLSHAREGRVCWGHAAAFTTAALPGVIAGTALGETVSGRVLIAAFAGIMLAAAAATWRKAKLR